MTRTRRIGNAKHATEMVMCVFAVEVDTPNGPVLVRTVTGQTFHEHREDAEYIASREKCRVARVVEFVRAGLGGVTHE